MKAGEALAEAEKDAEILGDGFVRVQRSSDGQLYYFNVDPTMVTLDPGAVGNAG